MRGKKVVNLNVKSGVIQILNSKVKEKGDFEDTDKALFMTLYNTALINGGYVLPDPYQYTDEIFSLIESVLSGKPPAPPPGE
jgi:HSP90 family molecular chaperone